MEYEINREMFSKTFLHTIVATMFGMLTHIFELSYASGQVSSGMWVGISSVVVSIPVVVGHIAQPAMWMDIRSE